MRGRLIQAWIFLSSRCSESDKSYKKRMRQKGRRNVKPGIFTDRGPPARINFTFFQDANRSIFRWLPNNHIQSKIWTNNSFLTQKLVLFLITTWLASSILLFCYFLLSIKSTFISRNFKHMQLKQKSCCFCWESFALTKLLFLFLPPHFIGSVSALLFLLTFQ